MLGSAVGIPAILKDALADANGDVPDPIERRCPDRSCLQKPRLGPERMAAAEVPNERTGNAPREVVTILGSTSPGTRRKLAQTLPGALTSSAGVCQARAGPSAH